jgi:K+-sensing histidine kinase KdpD/DNA-binding winged helix-turn-helix (wHTH) protein
VNDNGLLNTQIRQKTGVSVVRPYAETLAMVAASTLVGLLVAPRWGNSPVDLLYLPAVLAAAGFYGLVPGLLAAVSSSLAFNYFFTQPLHTFRIARAEDVATVALLFLVALVTSQLAARMRTEARAAVVSAARNATIAGFARRLLSCSSDQQVARVTCRELGRLFDCNAVVTAGLPEPNLVAARPDHIALTPSDIAAAAWAIESGKPAGRSVAAVYTTEWAFYPVRSSSAVLGAIGLARDDGTRPVADVTLDLLHNLIDQVALALERSRLEVEAKGAQDLRERNQLRAGLLATIGQDIEPLLSAIIKGMNDLRRGGSADKALISAVGSEVGKLRRYLSNLLDLGPESDQRPVAAGDVTIDLFRRTVSKGGAEIHLTPKEYSVLAELAKYPGRVLSHAHLLRTAWGPAQEDQIDYLRVAVRALRQKLENEPSEPRLIINEPGVGYRLVV